MPRIKNFKINASRKFLNKERGRASLGGRRL